MGRLNQILHQELRLSVISFLATIEKADFKKLLEVTGASKGNLSVQLNKLQDAHYLKIKKSFKGNYPHTECRITPNGKKAFEEYLTELKKLVNL